MTVKDLITKLKNCNKDWTIKFAFDYSASPDEFYFDLDAENRMYTIYQGCCGT